ncbi:hypothetical protein LCGC14_2943270 [marine sediment metagenome]|uniref:Uncharacterized protein n=1 Tax=marine sediment metagenome TaxID=412755 RepID=A0A0F9A8E3_9ZZZZ
MGKFGIFNKLRELIAVISFSIFLWAVGLSEDEYLTSICEQGQALKEAQDGNSRNSNKKTN